MDFYFLLIFLDTLLPVRWCAPEILSDYKYTIKSDVWAYGITLYEIFTAGDLPYGGGKNQFTKLNTYCIRLVFITKMFITLTNLCSNSGKNREAATLIKTGTMNPKPEDCPDYIYEIMLWCWSKKPPDRPTFYRIQEALSNAVNYDEVVIQQQGYTRVFAYMFALY